MIDHSIPIQLPGCKAQSVGHLACKSEGFDTRFGHILSFLLPLIQEGQLSVIGGSMCTKVLVNRLGGLSLSRKSVVRITNRPNMTLDVYRRCKTTMQQQQQPKQLNIVLLICIMNWRMISFGQSC